MRNVCDKATIADHAPSGLQQELKHFGSAKRGVERSDIN